MKVTFAENNVISQHGLQAQQTFQIRTNAHAFKLLSSGLYSNKTAAVLREIGCNAMDAHIAAGKPDLPFEVKLPNAIERDFYIRDFGIGLSHEQVMELYTTYFASTKQESNDFTGAFGLGSKSPFSYTDSFTVTAVQAGSKRTYTCYLNNEGAPTIALMNESEADADWPSGVMISFPVPGADVSKFQTEAQSIYQWFKVKPTIRGGEQIKTHNYKQITPVLCRRETLSYSYHQSMPWGVVMGNVCYPLTLPASTHSKVTAEKALMNLLSGYLLLDIGDVQVAASREALQYDPQSVKVLTDRLTETAHQVADFVHALHQRQRGASWKEQRDIRQELKDYIGYMPYNERLVGLLIATGTAQQQAIDMTTMLLASSIKVPDYTDAHINVRVCTYSTGLGKLRLASTANGQSCYIDDAAIIVYGKAFHVQERVRHYLSTHTAQIILVTPAADARNVVTDAHLEAVAQKLSAKLHNMPIQHITTLDVPPKRAASVAVQKAKRIKTASATLPAVDVTVRTPDGKVSVRKLTDLGPKEKFFVATATHSRWTDSERVVGIDGGLWPLANWDTQFQHFGALQAACKTITVQAVVELPSEEIKGLSLEKFGFRPVMPAMRDWLLNQAVRQQLTDQIGNWNFQYINFKHPNQWDYAADAIVALCHEHPSTYKALAKLVKRQSVLEVAKDIAAGMSGEQPEVLARYNNLRPGFNLPALVTKYAVGTSAVGKCIMPLLHPIIRCFKADALYTCCVNYPETGLPILASLINKDLQP